jgi:hypothetical protein
LPNRSFLRTVFDAHFSLVIRGQKVMLDPDLAPLYQVPTFRLNEAMKRNLDRFPEDFMFRLEREEFKALNSSQIAMSSKKHRGVRYLPYAFTEHGVAMLSAVLRSERAEQMSILVVRSFIKMRELLATHKDLAVRVSTLAPKQKDHHSMIGILANKIVALLLTA